MTRLSWIPQQAIKIATAHRADLMEYVVGCIHLAPGSSSGLVRAWKVNLPSLTDGGEIPIPNAQAQKDDSVAFEILPSGDLLVTYCETAPGGGGATSQPEAKIVPGVFGPAPAASGSAGGPVEAPGGFIRIKSVGGGAMFSGTESIALGPFGVPTSARMVYYRVCVSAPVAGARARVGPHMDGDGAAMLTVAAQIPGQRMYGEGRRAPGPGHVAVVWADKGELSELYLDVTGWDT